MLLPYELAALISCRLSARDVYECIFVCQAWHAAFIPSLYHQIIINRDSNVHQRILSSHIELGRCVHHIIIDDGVLSFEDMQRLRNKCPGLGAIHFRWCTPTMPMLIDLDSTSTMMLSNQYFYRSPLPLLSAIDGSQLSHLNLECHEPPSWKDIPPPASNGDITDLLKYTPYVQDLSLRGFFPTLHIHHLDDIHACCPKLVNLELTGLGSIECKETELVRVSRYLRNHYHQQQQQGGGGDELPTMRQFRLVYPYGWHSLSTWLEYILVRYKQLDVLELENTGPLPVQFHPTVLFFLYTGMQLPQQLSKVSFIHLGATNIQRLHPPLARLPYLTDVCIRDQGIHYFFNFSGLISCIHYCVQQLCIPLPAYATAGHYEQLRHCLHLTELTLEMSRHELVRLDLVFANCRWLKHLTMMRTQLTMDMVKKLPAYLYHTYDLLLEKLAFENTTIDGEKALGRLLAYLQGVVDLYLVDCTFKHDDRRGLAVFWLPERTFRSVHIVNARICFDDFVKRIPGIPNYPVTLFGLKHAISGNDDINNNSNHKRQRRTRAQWWEVPVRSQTEEIHRLDPEYPYERSGITQVSELDADLMEQVADDPYHQRRLTGKYKRYARMITLSGFITLHCARINDLQLNRHIIR